MNAHATASSDAREAAELTAMLSGLCRQIEPQDDTRTTGSEMIDAVPDLRQWWTHEQAIDANRRAQTQAEQRNRTLKRFALAKLTYDERILLGLPGNIDETG